MLVKTAITETVIFLDGKWWFIIQVFLSCSRAGFVLIISRISLLHLSLTLTSHPSSLHNRIWVGKKYFKLNYYKFRTIDKFQHYLGQRVCITVFEQTFNTRNYQTNNIDIGLIIELNSNLTKSNILLTSY